MLVAGGKRERLRGERVQADVLEAVDARLHRAVLRVEPRERDQPDRDAGPLRELPGARLLLRPAAQQERGDDLAERFARVGVAERGDARGDPRGAGGEPEHEHHRELLLSIFFSYYSCSYA